MSDRTFNSFFPVVPTGQGSFGDGSVRRAHFPVTRAFVSVLGILGLALAVFAWGLGYKISLYKPQAATHCNVAKVWDKTPDHTSKVTKAEPVHDRIAALESYIALAPSCPLLHLRAVAYLSPRPQNPLSIARLEYCLPFRSPPYKTLV